MKINKKLFVLPLAAGIAGLALLAPVNAQTYTYERTRTYESPYMVNHFLDDSAVIDGPLLTPAPMPFIEDRVVSRPVYINDDDRRPLVIQRGYYPRRGLHLDFPFGDIDLR